MRRLLHAARVPFVALAALGLVTVAGAAYAATSGPGAHASGASKGTSSSLSAAYSGFRTGPVSITAGMTPVASLRVPVAGDYVVFAKTWVFDNVNEGVAVQCLLVAGSDRDEAISVLTGNSGDVVNGATVEMNIVHHFVKPGSVLLECDGATVNTSANSVRITAIRVGSITNSALSS
jgi:hypothetical protein